VQSLPKPWIAVKRLVLLSVCATAFLAAAPAYASDKSNPFGIAIVRFDGGTTPAEMRTAIAKAGGVVVTDLSPVGAMAVAPVVADFGTRIGANSRVTTFYPESMFDGPLTLDGKEGGSSVGPLNFGKSPSFPDPWHDASSFLGVTNPEGILQWDDGRMNVPAAWARTLGDKTVKVAILDTGVETSHRELKDNVVGKTQTFVPCAALKHQFGEKALKVAGLTDCGTDDREGHGTWVASRIAGALNGFASNGVAPRVQVSSYKVLASGFGGLPDWILSGLLTACSDGADLVNMSITGYLDPSDPTEAQTYLLFNDVVQYCRARGVTIFAAAGNEHVRVDRVTTTVAGRTLTGVGEVSDGPDGIATTPPGRDSSDFDLRGMLETPAGVPGVVMVSATNNANGAPPADDPFGLGMLVGARDQLAYYSSYGSRVDLAAPGGARRFNLPGWDGGDGNILYGGWGSLGALTENGAICGDPLQSSLFNFACFKVSGAGFGWLQGTSMSAPNALGVAALVISAKPGLRHDPDDLVARLEATARQTMTNHTGPNDPANTAPTYDGRTCATGYCHLDTSSTIGFSDAYGAGLVDAGAATAP
jgi:lantibiotic leader peptide-processing serine protease